MGKGKRKVWGRAPARLAHSHQLSRREALPRVAILILVSRDGDTSVGSVWKQGVTR